MQVRRADAADAQGIAEVHVRVWQIGYAPFIDPAYAATLSVRTSTMRWLASLADPLQADTVVAVEEIARTDPTLSNPLSEIGEGAGSDVLGWTSYGVNRNGLGLEVGEVYGIYVDPDHWGAGIGADLLIDATRALCEAGFQRAILWVLAEDRLAREFYEARGWQDEGVSAPHESGANVVRYAKDLA